MASAAYRTLYFPREDEYRRIRERAEAAGMSVSEYLRRAGLGDLPGQDAASPERLRQADEDARYWRERFEQMAGLAQDMQAEILQLRQEIRLREVARGGAAVETLAAGLGSRALKVLTSLRSADGKYRVYTEAELREELDLREASHVDALRAALADLYRLHLVEPQRNGWRARD